VKSYIKGDRLLFLEERGQCGVRPYPREYHKGKRAENIFSRWQGLTPTSKNGPVKWGLAPF